MWLIKIKTKKYTLQSMFGMENNLCTLDVFEKVCIKSESQKRELKLLGTNGELAWNTHHITDKKDQL